MMRERSPEKIMPASNETLQYMQQMARTAGLRLREQDLDAMSSHRPYRPGLGIEKALAEIERGSGIIYDAQVAAACLKLFREKGYVIPA
jgi:hypothetical protein